MSKFKRKSIFKRLKIFYFAIKYFGYFSLLRSLKYFIFSWFAKRNYDITFVGLNHFNRGTNGENIFFSPFYNLCKKDDINFHLFEETSLKGTFNSYPRNLEAIPLELVSLFQVLLRKLLSKKNTDYSVYRNYHVREVRVSSILKFLFFQKFKSKVYIVLAHNNVTLWRTINKDAIIIDYQHGMIWNGHDSTMVNSIPSDIKILNNIITMVYGKGFKQLLISNDNTNYYSSDNIVDVGYYLKLKMYKKRSNNKTILYSLQNVDLKSNFDYYSVIKNLLLSNKKFLIDSGYKILLKNHPRYDRSDALDISDLTFASFVPEDIQLAELADIISIHVTSKSTLAFDMALMGIPTIFIDLLKVRSPYEMFDRQYNYPLTNLIVTQPRHLNESLGFLEDSTNFTSSCMAVYSWARVFYQDFNFQKLLSKLKENK